MAGPSEIIIVRHVAVWYYLLTGLTALVAIGWMARRRLLGLGVRLLVAGIAVNALWEALLFTVWGRQYETLVPAAAHALYQSLTEFGPPLLVGVLLLDHTEAISLSAWREPQTSIHSLVYRGAIGVVALGVTLSVILAVSAPATLLTPITVYRELSAAYFLLAAALALVVLGTAVWQGNRTALVLFATLGAFNVLFEIVGLVGGYRSYHGLTSAAAIFVGLTESGTAAALVWLVVETATPDSALSPLMPSNYRNQP